MNKKTNDSLLLGLFIGLVFPAILFLIFNAFLELKGGYMTPGINSKFQLVLIALNAIVMRFFFVNLDREKTGKGIFMVTLLAAIAHVLYYYT